MELLKSERLILRKPKKNDECEILKLLRDPKVKKYLPGMFYYSMTDIDSFIELSSSNDVYMFVIEDVSSKHIIGIINAYKAICPYLICSYLIGADYRGYGFMPEALDIFIKNIFEKNIANAITFQIEKNNLSSLQVMKKINSDIVYDDENFLHFRISQKESHLL